MGGRAVTRSVLQRISGDSQRWRKITTSDSAVFDGEGRLVPRRNIRQVFKSKLSQIFLPVGYPNAVHKQYLAFSGWNFLHMTMGSAVSVLSTQSLLYGLGLCGGGNSWALSATINWILKDGLGQLGGIAIVSYLGNRFDVETRRYRFLAAIMLKMSCLLELLVPLAPPYFVVTASVANVLKNVAWMSTSATRVQINKHLIRRDNLGDLTGRTASQNTLASTLGTGLGALLSIVFVHSSGAPLENVLSCFTVFTPLALISLFAVYQSCTYVRSPRLTLNRLDVVCSQMFPELVAKDGKLRKDSLHQLERYVLGPEVVSEREGIFFSSDNSRLLGPMKNLSLRIEPEISYEEHFTEDREYWLVMGRDNAVSIWFRDGSDDENIFKGLLTAQLLRYVIGGGKSISVKEAESVIDAAFISIKRAFMARTWLLSDIYMEKRRPIKIIH